MEYELGEMNNTNSYTFDPTNQNEIPSVLSDKYDFSLIKFLYPKTKFWIIFLIIIMIYTILRNIF